MFNQPVDVPAEVLESEAKPDLCHKCGRCCQVATTFHSYPELQRMIAEGNQDAIDFLDIFEPFPSVDAARAVVPEQVTQVLKVVADRSDMKVEDVTFYHCRYVTEEGLCGIYERRPKCCRDAPYHGWSVMPPGCGFEGWQFLSRENQRADIRKLKEVQFQMRELSPDGVHLPARNMTLAELQKTVDALIKPWRSFGADFW